MLDHISIPVADIKTSAIFYDAVLATVGLERRKEFPLAIGYGPDYKEAPVFWILAKASDDAATPGVGMHISFQAPGRANVDAFHAAAIALGAKDAGPPGERPEYTQPFYGAFVFDLDGFKIEAVCRQAGNGPHADLSYVD